MIIKKTYLIVSLIILIMMLGCSNNDAHFDGNSSYSIIGTTGKGASLEGKVEVFDENNNSLGSTTNFGANGFYSIPNITYKGKVKALLTLTKYQDEMLDKAVDVYNLKMQSVSYIEDGDNVINITPLTDVAVRLLGDNPLNYNKTQIEATNKYVAKAIGIDGTNPVKESFTFVYKGAGDLNNTSSSRYALSLLAIAKNSNITVLDTNVAVKNKVDSTLTTLFHAIVESPRNKTNLEGIIENINGTGTQIVNLNNSDIIPNTVEINTTIKPIVATTGFEKIYDYVDNNVNPQPTIEDYKKLGIEGVEADNLNAINAAVNAVGTLGVDTVVKIQTVIDAKNANDAGVTAVKEDIAGNADATPATATQINAITGVSGAISGVDYSAALAAGTFADSANPTPTEIQTVIDAKNANDAAMVKIAAYADDNTQAIPTVQDYIDAGITGIDADNLDAINTAVDNVSAVDVDTAAKIQNLVDNLPPNTLPAYITITDTNLSSYIVSIYDNDYNVDIAGDINNTEKIIVKIHYSVSGGNNVSLPAYSSQVLLDSNNSQEGESGVKLTFSYEAQTDLNGTGDFNATLTVDDSAGNNNNGFLTKQLDIDNDSAIITIASFDYATDDNNTFGSYKVYIVNGVMDRMYSTFDNDNNNTSHKFIYTPVVSPESGKLWLNNNLGAEYANSTNPNGNFDPAKQSTDNNDYKAYGNLFQWGRKPDGHDLMIRVDTSDGNTESVHNKTGVDDGNITDEPTIPNLIRTDTGHRDWRENYDNSLWSLESSPNNVCPAGWRIPTQAELNTEVNATINTITNYTTAQDNFLKLTPAGRNSYKNISVSNTSSGGYYWTSDAGTKYSTFLVISSTKADYAASYRAFGFSVRCIKD